MFLLARLRRIGVDFYLLLLVATVLLATLLPASGSAATVVSYVAYYAVALLFFVYGAKLNTMAVVEALANWPLQLLVIACTYVAFPILGVGLISLLAPWLDENLVLGFIFLSILPSTVQSSIAFTSLAGGNVPAAVCAASFSNLVGVLLTPTLAAFLLHTSGAGVSPQAIQGIAMQILLPFVLGQAARPLIGGWIARHRLVTLVIDRGSILLIVYSAFSAGMVAGVWRQLDGAMLAIVIAADIVLLAAIMAVVAVLNRMAALSRANGMVMLFCGSTKSLASGLPIANILFAGQAVSLIILPLMLFHQIQLFVCAVLAQRFATSARTPGA